MKKFILIVGLLVLAACSKEEIKYEGAPLNIVVIGDIPEVHNENIHFESMSLEEFHDNTLDISTNFDAVMITPVVFEEASNDRFAEVYNNAQMPIIFFGSAKRNFPFTREGLTYETAHWESLDNGSHTTIYLSDLDTGKEYSWYFYLKDAKELEKLYKEIFQQVEML